jgi:hypothetical protein
MFGWVLRKSLRSVAFGRRGRFVSTTLRRIQPPPGLFSWKLLLAEIGARFCAGSVDSTRRRQHPDGRILLGGWGHLMDPAVVPVPVRSPRRRLSARE